ncbi:MAG: IS5 family transposase [Nanoarchaeota archaeon]|nr:IS5 family transposase [Nanoarchaeota archaeon]
MKKRKKKYIDTRDWPEYNNELIMRGYFYINPEFLLKWNDELKQMNAGKVGEPYFYPESMVRFLAVLHCKGNDYRALEGMMEALSENHKFQFPVISYSQICRRINALDIDFKILEEDMRDYLEVGVDGSGEKSTKRGGWMREKWKVKKGWIKVVIMGCKNKKNKKYVIDIRVGTENLNERKIARDMIIKNHNNIKKFDADGLHDCKATFNLCEKYNIPTAIKIRKNASVTTRKSSRRKEEVKIFKGMPYEEWTREKRYGNRWPITEGIFSGSKRVFGEYVSATKKRNMYHEVKLKFWAYNLLQGIT